MASGRNLLKVRRWENKPLRVLYWNAEDPQDENLRRGAAICQHYSITDEEIGGRLFLQSGREAEPILAHSDRGSFRPAKDQFDELERLLSEDSIDVLILDPWVGFHRLPENDNGAMGSLCYALARLAERRNCAIELIHHTRKPGPGSKQTETSVDDGRGASAVLAAMRSARVLNRMSSDEAMKAGIHPDERWRYSRISNGKANLAPPEKALWRRIVNEQLLNGPGGSAGDDIGVMEQRSWPDRAGGPTLDDVRAIQGAIAAGEWREDARSNEWAGFAVIEALGLDPTNAGDKARAREILAVLKEDGSLRAVGGMDRNRKRRTFIRVGKLNIGRKSQQTDDQTDEVEALEW
jgi:AAA domain